MVLNWVKCQGGVWCKLNTVNLEHDHFIGMAGVYMIWHGGTTPKVVYVGQGIIRDRIIFHRSNQSVQQYAGFDLFVTWASVSTQDRAGIEKYLASSWQPLVGKQYPVNTTSIVVNPPW